MEPVFVIYESTLKNFNLKLVMWCLWFQWCRLQPLVVMILLARPSPFPSPIQFIRYLFTFGSSLGIVIHQYLYTYDGAVLFPLWLSHFDGMIEACLLAIPPYDNFNICENKTENWGKIVMQICTSTNFFSHFHLLFLFDVSACFFIQKIVHYWDFF